MDLNHYYLQQMGVEIWQKRAPVASLGITLTIIWAPPDDKEGDGSDTYCANMHALLQKMLASIGLSEKQVHMITLNTETQIEAQHFIQEQFQLVSPKLILILGNIASAWFTKEHSSLSNLCGKWSSYQQIPCLISYHPAALLQIPAYKKRAYQHLQAVKTKLSRMSSHE